jgi:hypothetical protein
MQRSFKIELIPTYNTAVPVIDKISIFSNSDHLSWMKSVIVKTQIWK